MIKALGCAMLFVMTLSLPHTDAQDEPTPAPGAIEAAMAEYFANGLRTEMGLDDAQVEAIVPLVREMERERSRIRRERARTLGELRRAWRSGADEATLAALLERAEGFERAELDRRSELQARIDEQLGIRERIQFRFFSQRFRRRVQQRIAEIRGERAGEAGERPSRRLRPGARPRRGAGG